MRSVWLALLATLGGGSAQDEPVGTGPTPSPTPISWEFEFKFVDPQRIEVQLPGRSRTDVYWYVLYTVTNTSGTTQRFYPTMELVTEDLRVFDTDIGIPALVFDAIRERHKLTHPRLLPPTRVIGELLAGDGNAQESVAIWREVDLEANNFTIYIAGLSGETRLVRNPAYRATGAGQAPASVAAATAPDFPPGEAQPAQPRPEPPKNFTLRKTLEIRYTLLGSPEQRKESEPWRRTVRWIMR